jgi:heavy metal translocating P-type ATPase
MVDEAILTGEARPKKKLPGDDVLGGSLLLDGELRISAIRTAGDSALGKTITLMEEALSKKIPAEVTADRLVRWLVPFILTLAIVTGGYLLYWGTPFDAAMLRALSILVITCPCALGIAIPLAKVAFVRKAHDRGIIVCEPDALEQAKDLQIMVFDKTGTITEGSFSLRAVETIGITRDELLCHAAAVEAKSGHFLAREVTHKARAAALRIEEAIGFEELQGLGVQAMVANKAVAVGSRKLMEQEGFSLSSDLDTKARNYELQGMTVIFAGWEGMVHGFLVFGDCLKTNAAQTMKTLRARGTEVWLVSGDAVETTGAVAQLAGIDEFRGQTLPFQKVEIIKMLQQSGKKVGMVGDGINDAAALAQADVGIAMLTGTNFALGSADMHLLSSDPARILDVLDMSAQAVKAIRQNLFLAFIYNTLAIPLAMSGLINPLIAVTAMFASSLTVIGNTLRIAQSRRV